MVSIIRRALACLGSANDERYESKVSGTVGDKVSANAGVATIDRINRDESRDRTAGTYHQLRRPPRNLPAARVPAEKQTGVQGNVRLDIRGGFPRFIGNRKAAKQHPRRWSVQGWHMDHNSLISQGLQQLGVPAGWHDEPGKEDQNVA